ncbi:uncharacterized protein SPSK_06353 [Sporothrix schenckii 1099-18]|uniref:Uncharacterized protein n=1 Tax=Sporothrix schenckii 1099-18 TaxID=1397361 RepID=A0A0F2ML64_SPOSC|nr:uncharacterized protein SPSK_06353 [Sporothrix schenckii 1099-18]KJR89804.1 hypothetical protein SPSK_06353 [Sporothrix schenckii 1099-18]
MSSPLPQDIEPQTAIQEASDLASHDPDIVKKCWDNLGTAYRKASKAGDTLPSFPRWVLNNVPDAAIEQMMNVVCGKGARKIESYGPGLVERFGVPQWQFVLFLGPLPQNKVTLLNRIGKRRGLTFDGLFEELCAERCRDGWELPKGPFNFSPRELKCCVRDNDPEDEQGQKSDDGQHNVDVISHDNIVVRGSSDIISERGDEEDSQYTPSSPIDDDLPLETSSYASDMLDTGDAFTVQEVLPESVEIPTSGTTNPEGSSADDASSPLFSQKLNQSQGGDIIVPEALGNYTGVPTLEQAGTSDATDQTRAALYSDVSDTGESSMQELDKIQKQLDDFRTRHEELRQEDMAIRREEAAVEGKRQAYRAKRLRANTVVLEFIKRTQIGQ